MSATKRAAFRVEGMCCAEEISALRRDVGSARGVARLDFDLLNSKMTAEYDPAATDTGAIIAAVAKTGMKAIPWQTAGARPPEGFWQRRGRLIMTTAGGLLTVAALGLHWRLSGGITVALGWGSGERVVPAASIILYLAAIVCGVWHVAPRAWAAARRLRPDMNFLMTVAVIGAAALGDWFEAASVAFLFSLALLLEAWSVHRARRAVQALMDLSPPVAHLVSSCGCEVTDCPVEEVPEGATVVVRPGERIPLDGVVAKGNSAVNQAPITGESIPVAKDPGDEVFAGTVNGEGALEVRVTKRADETLLARIALQVQEAQGRRAPAEQWVDRFARVYTPVMIAFSLAVMVAPPLLAGGAWGDWFYRGLVILVIACPCALVISTPVSIVAGLAAAAHRGVLIKGGLFLEIPSRLRAIAFDKTGTLTHGEPRVQQVLALNGHRPRDLLAIAAGLEANSTHPLARAVLERARAEGVDVKPAAEHRILPGRGAEGVVLGERHWIGSHRLIHERGADTPELHRQALALEDAGHSVVAVGNERHVCGLLSVADAVRRDARGVVAALRREGVRQIAILTGDNAATAESIAQACGVDAAHSELLPEDKVRAVERLVSDHGAVAMVGDGVNDAPAMARASVGIAMGAAGSDAAIETADIALMADDLTALPWLVRHSLRTMAIIRQNIGFALGVKVVFLALALPGLATLWMAIAADMGASLLVIANGLRLLSPPRG